MEFDVLNSFELPKSVKKSGNRERQILSGNSQERSESFFRWKDGRAYKN
jgi:hypothetical protein